MTKINNIVIFTIDSLYSNIILDKLSHSFGHKISLICISDRYKGKHGSFFHQLKKNLTDSGMHFVNYLSIVFIYYKFLVIIFNWLNKIISPDKNIKTIKQIAKINNISILKTEDINKKEVEEIIKKNNPDLIISVYFDQLIKDNIFSIPKYQTINLHPALLPDYKGPFPTFWALKNNEKKFGLTVHYVDKLYDTGDVILRKEIDVGNPKSVLGLDYKIFSRSAEFIKEVIDKIENEKVESFPQKSKGSYYSFPKKNDVKEMKKSKIKLFTVKEFIRYFI